MSNFPLPAVIEYLHSDAINGTDFKVVHDAGRLRRSLFEAFTIPVWDEIKLGVKKTIAEYMAISEIPQFKAWHENWYRDYKLSHGLMPAQAEAKVKRAFPD